MLRSARASQKGSSKSVTSAGHRRRSTASGEAIIPETFDTTFKAISSFVPTKLLKNLAEDGTIMRPHSTTTHGICLLADISGFTRLSGAYCARGKDGLDGLQNATSGYMGSLVNTVYSYGGDVIKFAGDALVCIFEPPNLTRSSLERCCASALQCAWVLKEFSTAELTLHVGISCGDICFGQLGGFENKWECLISGTCISQLSQCLDDAPSKHVAITKECHECLVSSQLKLLTCEATALKSGNYLIHSVVVISSCNDQSFVRQVTDDTLFLSQTACYVPRPVTQSLMAGSFAFLAELREVTTVFIKFDGYSDSRYKDLLSLQRFFYACQEILSDSGGFMRQFLVDDKGCVLIALWGVPTATFHDDCRRALGASVRIRSKLLDMKMSCSSGITTGVVYCGTVGNELRREYAAVGDVVNLAARLMSKANGEILLDENTYSRLPESVHRKLTRQPLMAVKGKDKPIVSYQFDSTRTVQDDGRFGASLVNSSLDEELPIRQICKDAFMGPLTSLLSDAPAKEIQFLVLEGRLGTGREGSVSWLHRWCNTRNLRLVSVRLTKANSIEDYRAVAKIFRNMMGEENFDDIDRQSFVVNSLLKQMYPKDMETREKVAYPTMRHALAVVCPLNQAFNRRASSTDSCSPVIDRDRDREAYCSSRKSSKNEGTITFSEKFEANIPSSMMLASLKDIFSLLFAEQPMVLIIEDAHEMDEPSWKVILSLLKMQMKAFIVLTQEPISYLMSLFNAAGSETPIGELINPEAVMTYDWVDTYVNRLTDYKKSSYILLPELTFSEVRAHVANTLKVSAKDLPEGLDQMAFDLSGGNPFWVEEISTFLRTYGVQEFISSLEVKGDSNIKNCIVSSLQFGRTRGILESRSSVSLDKADSVTTPEVYSADCRATSKSMQGSSSKLFNLLGTIKSGSKLEFLVVCRFAKLSMDEQSTARTASIIGTTFTADVLLSALPIQLGAYLTAILQSLIENHWLKSKTEVNAGGTIKVEYSFTHPLMHKTLYDLTPSSIKRALHLSIAKYIEGMYFEDKSYFMSLGYHYCRSEHTRKTYEYLSRAAYEMILSDRGSMDESIILIQTAAAHIGSDIDAIALLGVVCRGIQKLKERSFRISDSAAVLNRGGSKKAALSLLPTRYSNAEDYARNARFLELEDTIEDIRLVYQEANKRHKEARPDTSKEGDKERRKSHVMTREKSFKDSTFGSALSGLSKKIMVGPIVERKNSKVSNVYKVSKENEHGGRSISGDESEDQLKKLLQKHVHKSSLNFVSVSIESWQEPLIAIRGSYLMHHLAEAECPTRRISMSNLMTILVESPKSRSSVSLTKVPSTICSIS